MEAIILGVSLALVAIWSCKSNIVLAFMCGVLALLSFGAALAPALATVDFMTAATAATAATAVLYMVVDCIIHDRKVKKACTIS